MNVALDRPSYLSTTHVGLYGTHWPRYANDGDKSNCNGTTTPPNVVASSNELNPWYGVDLGVALWVAGVQFTNRADHEHVGG